MRKTMLSMAFAALATSTWAQAPYHLNYGIPMNGPYHGASQWYQLEMSVFAEGTVLIHQVLTNDVADQGWCGTFRLHMRELGPQGPGSGPLLLDAVSAGHCVGPKIAGGENRAEAGFWELHLNPETARRFMARPDVWAGGDQYSTDSSLFGTIMRIAAQVIPIL